MLRIILTLVIVAVLAPAARADVEVVRKGHENPALVIAKSTLWGGLTGLVLGGAIALVAEDNEDDIIKWSFVAGTFGGFGFGVYHVLTRPQPSSALLQIDDTRVAMNVPSIMIRWEDDFRSGPSGARVTLLSYSF